MNTHQIGQIGESTAAEFLEKRGYSIECRNFRTRRGEIDIICSKNDRIIFFEIKTADSLELQDVEFMINRAKRSRIIAASKEFLLKNPRFDEYIVQYDVLFIQQKAESIEHLENAFFEDGIV